MALLRNIVLTLSLGIFLFSSQGLARPKGHHHKKQAVPDNPKGKWRTTRSGGSVTHKGSKNTDYDNRNKGKDAELKKQQNNASSPNRPKPGPESIPPQQVEIKVQEHPRKQEKEKQLKLAGKNQKALKGFPLKGTQKETKKAKDKKYPSYDKLQGKVPIEGPPQYPPVEQKVAPPLPATIDVGKPQALSTAPNPTQNSNANDTNNQQQQQQPQDGKPQQKSKVHKKGAAHHGQQH